MTTTISDLSEDLVAEILFRVPMTSLKSVRSTCKQWNTLSRNRIFGKVAKAKNQFLGFRMKDFRICSVRMDLRRMRDNVIDLSIKQISELKKFKAYKVYHCNGLLLCILKEKSRFLVWKLKNKPRLLVWNPYLGQKRWIPHRFDCCDDFLLGYDNVGNHKIFQFRCESIDNRLFDFKIYDFSSNSWRVLDISPIYNIRPWYYSGVTLKGNAYFYEKIIVEGEATIEHFILCFDFTSERFGPRLSLPFQCVFLDTVILSDVRDKQLAVFFQHWSSNPEIIEIWVTNKVDHNEVFWYKWLEVDLNLIPDFPYHILPGSFFIDEENKVAVIFDLIYRRNNYNKFYQTVHIYGENGYFKSIDIQAAPYGVDDSLLLYSPSCSSYVPSLVEIA